MLKKLLIALIINCTLFYIMPISAAVVCNGKPVLGAIEKVKLLDQNIVLDAKLDTGADSSSLTASNITTVKQAKKLFIRFEIYLPTTQQKFILTEPLVGYVQIKTRKEENLPQSSVRRPVINLPVCIGQQKMDIAVNLADRADFNYPLLIGRDTLQKLAIIVDVSKKYSVAPECN